MATQKIFTPEEAVKHLEQLPPEVRNIIYGPEMRTVLMDAGDKQKLHLDQVAKLEAETSAVMLGFTEPHDFVSMLVEKLVIDNEKATAIAKYIDEMLFSKIRNSMKQADTHITSTPVPSNPPAISAPLVPVGNKTDEKSVVMPSAAKAPVPAVSQPAAPTIPLADAPTPPMIKPAGLPAMPHVDAMLSQPTVSIAPKPDVASATPPTPAAAPVSAEIKKSDTPTPPPIYKTDPYHEPID